MKYKTCVFYNLDRLWFFQPFNTCCQRQVSNGTILISTACNASCRKSWHQGILFSFLWWWQNQQPRTNKYYGTCFSGWHTLCTRHTPGLEHGDDFRFRWGISFNDIPTAILLTYVNLYVYWWPCLLLPAAICCVHSFACAIVAGRRIAGTLFGLYNLGALG